MHGQPPISLPSVWHGAASASPGRAPITLRGVPAKTVGCSGTHPHITPSVTWPAMSNPLPYLDICAREPIQMPGAIQPFGALIVLDVDDFRVLHRSENAATLLGYDPQPGQPFALNAGLIDDLTAWRAG